MKKVALLVSMILVVAVFAFAQGPRGGLVAPGPDNSPKVGEMAPDFQLIGNDWNAQTSPKNLADFKGKKNVLLMFFPGAFTPGCTREFTEAGQAHEKIVALNVEMIGISRDMPGSLAAFKTQVGAKNGFVSDVELVASKKYDAVSTARTPSMAKRYYFLIDQTGKIVWKDTTNSLLNTDQVLTAISQNLK